MISKREWVERNEELLEYLFYELKDISLRYFNIDIKENNQTVQRFIRMMYDSSSKQYILPYQYYPDCFFKD